MQVRPPSPRRPTPSAARLAAVFSVTVTLLLLLAPSASAHAALTGSDPADGATVAIAPQRVTLTFDDGVSPSFAAMTVSGPDGSRWARSEPVVRGRELGVDVGELGPAGTYTVAYRVTSADGHPVSGTVSFTTTQDGGGQPAAAAAAGSDAPSGGSSLPVWPFVAVAVVVLAGGAVLVLRGTARSGA
ncbi:copper resistance protein CopC [Rhodococcus aerolatus]